MGRCYVNVKSTIVFVSLCHIANVTAVSVQYPALRTGRICNSLLPCPFWSTGPSGTPSKHVVNKLNIQIPLKNSLSSQLRLQFEKSSDRWSHCWQLIDADGHVNDVLVSVEGSAEDNFPASSAMQEINLHELPTGHAVLGVGMAGKGHWSASYSVEAGDQPSIKCDLACLLKQLGTDGQWLGSTYSVAENVTVEHNGLDVRFSVNGQSFTLTADPTYASIDAESQQVQVVPTKISDSKTVATRWLFSATS